MVTNISTSFGSGYYNQDADIHFDHIYSPLVYVVYQIRDAI